MSQSLLTEARKDAELRTIIQNHALPFSYLRADMNKTRCTTN